MKTRYLIVSGDIVKPIPDRMMNRATHALDLNDDWFDKHSGSGKNFKVVNGLPVAKTLEEIELYESAQIKDNIIQEAESLYEELKNDCCVDHNGETYDLKDRFLFEYQNRKKSDNIRIKTKKGKIKSLNKSDADTLERLLAVKMESVADAFNADMDAIESGDYSCANLKALK